MINDIVKERPKEPFVVISSQLMSKSEQANQILGVSAKEVLSAQALPLLEVTIETIQV